MRRVLSAGALLLAGAPALAQQVTLTSDVKVERTVTDASGKVTSSPAVSTEELTALFLDACVKGEIRLDSKQAPLLPATEAPRMVRGWIAKDPTARLHRLSDTQFLLVGRRDASDEVTWTSRCLVFGKFSLTEAWKGVLAGLMKNGPPPAASLRDKNSFEIVLPSRRTVIVVSKYIEGNRMEVITFDKEAWTRIFGNDGGAPRIQSSYKPFGIGRDY